MREGTIVLLMLLVPGLLTLTTHWDDHIMTMTEDRILREAEFTPKVQAYWMLGGTLTCILTVIGILVLPFWLIFGGIFTTKYRKSMKCSLTERNLKFSKGILTRVEKTIPLEKITDLGMVQGPIMRAFDIHSLSVETAGQSAGPGALVTLVGIVDAVDFRNAVLSQRDQLADKTTSNETAPAIATAQSATPVADQAVLEDIRDTLHRIEKQLASRES